MDTIRLGKTELRVTRTSFGALPVQRIPMEDAVRLLRKAYDGGIRYFDTANAYTDSEKKLGAALSSVRQDIVLSTKSHAHDKAGTLRDIENSLRMLQTDYIDLFQFHNPAALPDANDPNSAYAGALEAKARGYIRHIGITNHRLGIAKAAIASGDYETLQFPFSYLASDEEKELPSLCKAADMGFIAMKGLAGGLLNHPAACRAFMRQYDNVVPIWGIQREAELEEWLALENTSPALTPELQAVIDADRDMLTGSFCRSCGYCLPCPAGIDIPNAARMDMLLRRSPYERYMTEEYREKMHRIEGCLHCNHCKNNCPYGLDTPELLKRQLADYDAFRAAHKDR